MLVHYIYALQKPNDQAVRRERSAAKWTSERAIC